MKNNILLVILTIQIMFFIGWAGLNSYALSSKNTKSILLKTIPVDPRDYLSGNYFILNYSFNNYNNLKKINYDAEKKEIYLVLKKDNKYYVEDYITSVKPINLNDEQIFIKGKKRGYYNLSLNIDKYFINENAKQPKNTDKVDVNVRVSRAGNAIIDKIFVNEEIY